MDNEHEDEQQTAMVAYQSNALMRAEIDTQISTAKAFPRSLQKFARDAKSMATLDQETAASCIYALPRGNKKIEGPSARFAEIVAVAWKNMRFGGRVVSEEENFLTAQGAAHDLESNIAITVDVRVRITKSAKNGQPAERYNDDMIQVAGLAATSKALRNAVLKVVPKAYWQPILNEAKRVALGDATTLVQRRDNAVRHFAGLGVNLDRILAALGKRGIEDIDLEDIVTLSGIKTAINEGDTTVEQAFPPLQTGSATAAKDKLKPKGEPPTGNAETKPITKGQTKHINELLSKLDMHPEDQEKLLGGDVAALTESQADDVLAKLRQLEGAQSKE